MSKAKTTHKQPPHEPHDHRCCCSEAEKTPAAEKEFTTRPGIEMHEGAHHQDGEGGCCRGGKVNK
jgi:hypothetical protein